MSLQPQFRQRIALALSAAILLAGLFFWWNRPSVSWQDALEAALHAQRKSDFETAIELASRIPESAPQFTAAMQLAGESAVKLERLQDALAFWTRIPPTNRQAGLQLLNSICSLRIHTGELTQAFSDLKTLVSYRPLDPEANSRIAFLYAACGRNWSARSHLEVLLRSGSATVQELCLLGDIHRPVDERPYLEKCRLLQPQDLNVRLGLVQSSLMDGQIELSYRQLREMQAEAPNDLDIWLTGALLIVDHSTDLFPAWLQLQPEDAEFHPDVWFVRARYCHAIRQLRPAIRCCLETLQRSPAHRQAFIELARLLKEVDSPEADAAANYAHTLFQLSEDLKKASDSNGMNAPAVRRIVERLDSMDRIWEACAWAGFALDHLPEADWARQVLLNRAPLLSSQLPLIPTDSNPVATLDRLDFPLWTPPPVITELPADLSGQQTADMRSTTVPIQLSDHTQLVGIDFIYQNAADTTVPGQRMQEQTGGGIAVIDLDLDGFADLCLTQGSAWTEGHPEPLPSPELQDRIYRNLRGLRFNDITRVSGILDPFFGQGCAVGDLNSDGFPDLLIANIGSNTLWLNNGDGTFSQAAAPSEDPLRWSSSVAIVDINGDSDPDIIDIAYVSGPEVYQLICRGKSCSPSVFDGTVPRVHLSDSSGGFRELEVDVSRGDAKGLGLVVYRNAPDNFPAILISNDQTPKFLLELNNDTQPPRMLNRSAASGIAMNGQGVPTAAMGIAAADLDQNGLQDFFITNFHAEPNSLFTQVASGIFQDRTITAGLQAGGLNFVSWGTQFIDFDLDGDEDIFVASGHIDDFRPEGGEFAMLPQVFRNRGELQFEEVNAVEAGEVLSTPMHGRGVAVCDWNADGIPDLAVSTSSGPAKLITNTTTTSNGFLKVRLSARHGDRDAWFSTGSVTTADQTITRQLTAGSGFHSSNERCLFFGLGPVDMIEQVQIIWPSGHKSLVQAIPANATLYVSEEHSSAVIDVEQQLYSIPVELSDPQSF